MNAYSDMQIIWPALQPDGDTETEKAVKQAFQQLLLENLRNSLESEAQKIAQNLDSRAASTAQNFLLLILRSDDPNKWQQAINHEKKRGRDKSKKLMDVLESNIHNPPTRDVLEKAFNIMDVKINDLGGTLQNPVRAYINSLKATLAAPALRYLLAFMLQEVAK